MIAVNRVAVNIAGHGLFIAPMEGVQTRLQTQRKAQMIRNIAEIWPEMIRAKTWTREQLRRMPAYVLAVILEQI